MATGAEGAVKDVLVHACSVYLYQYDTDKGSYTQLTDSVVGCALLSVPPTDAVASCHFKLLFYNAAQKAPVLQTPVDAATRFTPQQDHYVNFYDHAQHNFSMRFKDDAGVRDFLVATAVTKAQSVVQARGSYTQTQQPSVIFADELDAGKPAGGAGLGPGDIAGVAIKLWRGTGPQDPQLTWNPMELWRRPPVEEVSRDDELKRLRVGDDSDGDAVTRVLALGLAGMNKHGKRVVAVVLPATQEWAIAHVELVKVKKSRGGSVSAPSPVETASKGGGHEQEDDDESTRHDNLIKRMASLSRMGSKQSGLIASLSSRKLTTDMSPEKPAQHEAENAMGRPSMAPQAVPLPGLQPARSTTPEPIATPAPVPAPAPAQPTPERRQDSVTARIFAPQPLPTAPTSMPSLNTTTSSSTLTPYKPSSEMESLLKEQSDLDRLRKQLEDSKRELAQDNDTSYNYSSRSSALSMDVRSTAPSSSSSSAFASSSTFTPSFSRPPSSQPSLNNDYGLSTASSLYTSPSSTNRFASATDSLPSFTPTVFPSPSSSSFPQIPPPPTSFGGFNSSRPFSSALVPAPMAGSSTSMEVENGVIRIQRSVTNIESTLQDLQAKMDRLLNLQSSSLKSTNKYSSSAASSYSSLSYGGVAASPSASSTSSSSTLLKNLEKALVQRDQLQETNTRLQDAKDHLEATVEDLQTQHESLQLENKHLLDKLQSAGHLQQEKFRLEMRSLQQQLNHTQEQMLAYQEENMRLRQDLAQNEDVLRKEKAQLQEEARKQLEQMQRQYQSQLQRDSMENTDKLKQEKQALELQVNELMAKMQSMQIEKDTLAGQLRQQQTQQAQLQDEKAKVQSQQDSRVQELQRQLQQFHSELSAQAQESERARSEVQQLRQLMVQKDQEIQVLQENKSKQEYEALSELLKEFMNDIYFHFQDAFEEDAEFTGKEIVTAIRKILKQNTMDILSKLEEFWHQQAQQRHQAQEVLVLAARNGSAQYIDQVEEWLRSSNIPLEVLTDPAECASVLTDRNVVAARSVRECDDFALLFQPQQQRLTSGPSGTSLHGSGGDASELHVLQKKLIKREKKAKALAAELEQLKSQLAESTSIANNLRMEQDQFFHDVTEMKGQYDRLLENHQNLMWEYLPERDPDMSAIPVLAKHLHENARSVGRYEFQSVLGYGQYAVVYATSTPDDGRLAIKAIDKEKLVDLVALHRINSEIATLQDRALHHPNILALREVIHTRKHIYLVTERGGKDMFEYFGAHEDGMSEETIKDIIQRIAEAVQVLHAHSYCHRDLKPENILLAKEHGEDTHTVKLIDFGLCTKIESGQDAMLQDFCGSPGFFAPEILLQERYDGMKADVWSLGCILLEMVLGNATFASLWMNMYEFNTLKDRRKFAELVRRGLSLTREHCQSNKWTYSTKLRQLLLATLCENPQDRPSVRQMLAHSWFVGDGVPTVANTSPVQRSNTHTHHVTMAFHAPENHHGQHHPHQPHQLHQQPHPHLHRQDSHSSQRSPSKMKSVPTALGELHGTSIRLNIVVRPMSADDNGSALPSGHSSNGAPPMTAASAPVSPAPSPPKSSSPSIAIPTGKICLPSLSPDKQPATGPGNSSRGSPERAFVKQRSTSSHHINNERS
ncbi:TPA: LOW QUALITY PROTEIN: hypothetical protein N0F65_007028 [Lagenidium giganteum]|uniref:Protein kinase domain-containing protein n=1 Tax=Lagenidium giganteum TaxID=4803 RepID=A0AAV2YYL8_9STRA|nr:TPA: LOW QUALITY PROTEIN: hypothetical protein N0F65_007028 [Lagenidium giganteum]